MSERRPWWKISADGTGVIGHIGVDAGMVYLGDPCYLVPDDGPIARKSASGKLTWDEFLTYVQDHGTSIWPVEPVGPDSSLGIVVGSGYGDGVYPVTATLKDGRVASVTITFIEPDEEDDEAEDEAA